MDETGRAGIDAARELRRSHNDELLRSFTRLTRAGGRVQFDVALIVWRGTRPDLVWSRFRSWRREPKPDELRRAQEDALRCKKYFQMCGWCRTLNNTGHMSPPKARRSTDLQPNPEWNGQNTPCCQGCAERLFGVVH